MLKVNISQSERFKSLLFFRLTILMIGAPGIGKSMLAKRLMTILLSLSPKAFLEVQMSQRITGGSFFCW